MSLASGVLAVTSQAPLHEAKLSARRRVGAEPPHHEHHGLQLCQGQAGEPRPHQHGAESRVQGRTLSPRGAVPEDPGGEGQASLPL